MADDIGRDRLAQAERDTLVLRRRLLALQNRLAAVEQGGREAGLEPPREREEPRFFVRVVSCYFNGTIGVLGVLIDFYRHYTGEFMETVATDANGYARFPGYLIQDDIFDGYGYSYQIQGRPRPLPPYDVDTEVYRYEQSLTITHPNFIPGKLCTNCTSHFEQINRTTLKAYDAYGNTGFFTSAGTASHTGGGKTITYQFVPEGNPDTRFYPWRLGIKSSGGSGALGFASIEGVVARVNLTNQGRGYFTPPSVVFSGGGGSGAAAVAFITAPGSQGLVIAINLTDPGSGYTSTPGVLLVGGGPGGINPSNRATAAAVISARVTALTITNPGSGYNVGSLITFTGGGGFGAMAVVSSVDGNGGITGVTLVNGADYSSPPAVVIGPPTYAQAFGTAVLNGGGGVASVTITDSGSGYGAGPTIAATFAPPPGPGVTATGFATIFGAQVGGVTITNPGSGYATPPALTIAPPPTSNPIGTRATATANLSGGHVASYTVTDPGSGYTQGSPSLAISGGGGTGATGRVILSGTQVGSIDATPGGWDYSTPPGPIFHAGGGTFSYATGRRETCSPYLARYDYSDNPRVAGPILPANNAVVLVKP